MVGGDLSKDLTGAAAAPIYNPYNAHEVNGVLVRDPFAGNIIPPNLIKPYSKAYAEYWFPTTDLIPNSASNWLDTRTTARTDNQINARIDQSGCVSFPRRRCFSPFHRALKLCFNR